MENILTPNTDNVIFIEFYNKKHFPPGIWLNEPDFCKWESHGFLCLAIRDMSLGMWRGFVKLTKDHPAYGKDFKKLLDEDFISHIDIHGGLATIGKLPAKYKEYNDNSWWIGFECTQGEDYLPLLRSDPDFEYADNSTYKTLHYVRTETINLARQLKCLI